MKFLCIAPIYNHQQHWLENLIQLFLDQDHDDATLVVVDDRPEPFSLVRFGGIPAGEPNLRYLHFPSRCDTLMDKYRLTIETVNGLGIEYDAVCMMDDDDIYLPEFLSQHAKVLETHAWSYPSHVYSTFGRAIRVEETGGRFWASSAMRRDALEKAGGFGSSANAAFDQEMLWKLRETHGEPGTPQGDPQYVYMWEMTEDSHCSGLMRGMTDTSWYGATSIARATGPIVNCYNEPTLWVYSELRKLRFIDEAAREAIQNYTK